MKKKVLLLIFLTLLMTVAPLGVAAAQEEYYEYRVLHNGARLYAAPSIEEGENVLALLEQSAVLVLLSEEVVTAGDYRFYRVEANGKAGYMLVSDVYYSRREFDYEIVYKRVKTPSLYGKAAVYAYPEAGTPIAEYKDGERVSVVKGSGEYGSYEKIVYGEGYAYMQSAYLTTGLAKGQTVSIIIAGIILALASLTGYLLLLARRRLNAAKKE
ncbi:MAG: hypothetical protein ACOYIQ_06705 [Christensenellales bacterium]|jgi:hypothetical protein